MFNCVSSLPTEKRNQVLMRPEVNRLDVPSQQLKLGRSKSLNTPRSSCFSAMNIRPKRTYSLPNREKTVLPIVQIQCPDNGRVEEENNLSDRETERNWHLSGEEYSNGSKSLY